MAAGSRAGPAGRGPHGAAHAREVERDPEQGHQQQRDRGILDLLGRDAQIAEADVAHQWHVEAARIVAEAEADHVFQHDADGQRADGHHQRPALLQRANGQPLRRHRRDAGAEESEREAGLQRPAQTDIGIPAGIGPDRGQRTDGKVRVAEHGEDRREADGRDRKDGPGHEPVEQGLDDG